MPLDQRRVLSATQAAEAIALLWRGDLALLGVGTWPLEGHSRLGLLQIGELPRPQLLWDAYLLDAEIDELAARLARPRRLLRGGLDFMYQTRWKVAWTEESDRVRIYDRRGLRCDARPDTILLRRPGGRERTIAAKEAKTILAEGHAFKSRSQLLLELRSEERIEVVCAIDRMAPWADDPWAIYETWTLRAAAALAAVLPLPVERRGDV